ncbi:hypothetical protein AKJ16_DCAP23583 [Drosera capensis]
MQESIRIRKSAEPTELIKAVRTILVEEIKKEFAGHDRQVNLPRHVKQMITHEILQRLRRLPANANTETVENLRKEKLQEAKLLISGQTVNTIISSDEAGIFFVPRLRMLAEAMESKWPVLLEEIGFWMPVEITHKVHNDKPEGVDEFEAEPLPGSTVPSECHAELHTDYDGAAVRWGLTHHKESAADCCQACFDQATRAKPGEKKCNVWVYCPSESGCYSPDIYEHKFQECWLKYADNALILDMPSLNVAGRNTQIQLQGQVIVALIRARVVDTEYKHETSQVTDRYSSVFNPSVIELHVAASRGEKATNNKDDDEDEFLTARSSATNCSSAADTEAFFSVKTMFSCSDVNPVKAEYLAEPHRRSVMQEFSHCEGWPFGLCRKTLMNPPLPNPPSAPWSWYKDGVKIVRRHTLRSHFDLESYCSSNHA